MREAARERGEGSSGANGEGNGGWKKPRFVLVSSNLGSFGLMGGARGYGLYGASKALANFLVRWLALENGEEMVVCAVHPGPVKTDMGELAIEHLEQMGVDLKLEWLSVEESVRGLLAVIDDAERKNLNGRFIQHDGTELPW
ncbi:putative oxidoreductase [Diplodia seriata]|uniref:Putative oxidoreductase n=1 Tax=Diplodia seriata TaxID=420778 RepID=A0A1S8BKE4_9PEZI|nr:putative oxidoreductase [Diplodia seriata]